VGRFADRGEGIVSEPNAFAELIRRVRARDQNAAAELVRLYEPAIRRAARIRLADSRLRRLFDSVDISQSVFASFFVRAALGQYDLDKPERLLRLLVNMSCKKLIDHVRQQEAARRDFRRTRAAGQRLLSDSNDPGGQLMLEELLHEFRGRLSPAEQRLADLRASGKEWEHIASEQGTTAEAVRKRLTRAIERVAHELDLDGFTHA
jgi:RNA polymerase sigma-70 factor (ECF subfamily)